MNDNQAKEPQPDDMCECGATFFFHIRQLKRHVDVAGTPIGEPVPFLVCPPPIFRPKQ